MTASAASAYAAGFLSLPLFWPSGSHASRGIAASTATAAQQGQGEDAERLRSFGLNQDGSIARG